MSRYGIAEWYGRDFLSLTPVERRELAETALGDRPKPDCPFRSGPCSKKGGVCSIRPYEDRNGRAHASGGEPAIVCPIRFEQDNLIVKWLAEIVGFTLDSTRVAREVPFMQSVGTDKHAGKIDLVVASGDEELRWFGLEIQAVYFSGKGMLDEFKVLRDDDGAQPPFPVYIRRPDWRSSSAKRLMPQLQVKGPTLRRWLSKIAVAVDQPFFAALGEPSTEPSRDLHSGDVVWLVPELRDGRLHRGHWEVLTLEASGEKLLAANPVARNDFERTLRRKLRPIQRHHEAAGRGRRQLD